MSWTIKPKEIGRTVGLAAREKVKMLPSPLRVKESAFAASVVDAAMARRDRALSTRIQNEPFQTSARWMTAVCEVVRKHDTSQRKRASIFPRKTLQCEAIRQAWRGF